MKKFLNSLLKTIEYILKAIIVIVTIIVIFNFIQIRIMKKDYPNFFGYTVFKVISDSMAPTIRKNDVIVVKINDQTIKKQDIITYKVGKDFITHRVIDIQDASYITKGDYNNIGDKPIFKETVIGKVIKILPNFGVWKDVIMTPKILIVFFITMLLLSSTFKDWTKAKYNNLKDFRITNDSIIEGIGEDDEKKKS
ncbi:MAG: signal peptidase I [Mollicutes bacterium]|nr:signal peptidase I [Mollicutes bacterium]